MTNLSDLVILRTPRSERLADKIYQSFLGLARDYRQKRLDELRVPYPDGLPEQFRQWAEKLYTNVIELVIGKEGPHNLCDINVSYFPVGEIYPKVKQSVRRKHVYVVQTFNTEDDTVDPNLPLTELILINDALRRSSAAEITNIVPYLPYLRQDRVDQSRVPISARVVANLIERLGANRVVTFDMHADQEAGFFDIPVDNLNATKLFTPDFAGKPNFAAVAADEGALKKTRMLAEKCGLRVAMIEKKRDSAGVADVYYVIGEEEVEDRNVVMREDIIDTGSTLEKGRNKLREKGAREIYPLATHLVLSKKDGIRAEDRLRGAGIKIVGTDSIPRSERYYEENSDWLEIRSIAPMLAEAIFKIHLGGSLTEARMFDVKG